MPPAPSPLPTSAQLIVGFTSKLGAAWASSNSALCVGLDPDINKLPTHLQADPLGIQKFCIDIVDATADMVCAFKPQTASQSKLLNNEKTPAKNSPPTNTRL